MSKFYNQVRRYWFAEEDVSMPLIARIGTGGGNLPLVVDTMIFDEAQITCPTNGLNPKWNGLCHSLTKEAGRTDVIIRQREEQAEADDSP